MTIKCVGSDCTTELLPKTEEEALAQGWRQTDDYHVSPTLELVWLCSECVGRLISILTMQMQTVEHDARTAHDRRVHDLWANHNRRLEDLRRYYEERMYTIHRSYGEALGKLRSPAAKAAEAAHSERDCGEADENWRKAEP